MKTIRYWGKYHGYETQEEQDLVVDMVGEVSNDNLRWALKQLSIWREPENSSKTRIFQIHENLDKTFPIKIIKDLDLKIQDGGHFMVYRKSKLVNGVIDNELMKEPNN